MDRGYLIPFLPTLPMILEELKQEGWNCTGYIQDEKAIYRGVRLYHGQKNLQSDMLYLLRPTETQFPTNQFSYISTAPISGQANHFICGDKPDEVIMDRLLDMFSGYQQREQRIDAMTYRNASIQEMCELGAELLGNPVCIHDDWFIMVAMSRGVDRIMPPEYVTSSGKGFIPRAIVDDFRNDSDYLETFSHRSAQIWSSGGNAPDTLYVNLWDGAVYRGRLLVITQENPFRKMDFTLAEVLAQRILYLMNRKQPGKNTQSRSMDDVVYDLLHNHHQDPTNLNQLMQMLSWNKSDQYSCIRIRNQTEEGTSVMDHVLHSDLFNLFSDSYILFSGHEQCIVMNLTRNPMKTEYISHLLSPLCRDYCLYAGISSPVTDLRELHLAYFQAEFALSHAFRVRDARWIVTFSECAMDHIISSMNSPLQPWHLAAPELHALKAMDAEKGTQYFDTLRTYLLEERDIPRTAEKLIIHRTTLLYRLKKIRQMIRDDLEDPWRRLYYILSLWMLEQGSGQ